MSWRVKLPGVTKGAVFYGAGLGVLSGFEMRFSRKPKDQKQNCLHKKTRQKEHLV